MPRPGHRPLVVLAALVVAITVGLPAAAPVRAATSQDAEAAMVALLNGDRTDVGLAPVQVDTRLMTIARARSNDMATKHYFSHDPPAGSLSYIDQIRAAGITWYLAGEIIAYNFDTDLGASATHGNTQWVNSSGHYAIITNANYTHVGVGVAVDSTNGRRYWTAVWVDEVAGSGPAPTPTPTPTPAPTASPSPSPVTVTVTVADPDGHAAALARALAHGDARAGADHRAHPEPGSHIQPVAVTQRQRGAESAQAEEPLRDRVLVPLPGTEHRRDRALLPGPAPSERRPLGVGRHVPAHPRGPRLVGELGDQRASCPDRRFARARGRVEPLGPIRPVAAATRPHRHRHRHRHRRASIPPEDTRPRSATRVRRHPRCTGATRAPFAEIPDGRQHRRAPRPRPHGGDPADPRLRRDPRPADREARADAGLTTTDDALVQSPTGRAGRSRSGTISKWRMLNVASRDEFRVANGSRMLPPVARSIASQPVHAETVRNELSPVRPR